MAEALDIRALRHDDIGQVIALWEEAGFLPAGPDGLTVDEALDTMLTEGRRGRRRRPSGGRERLVHPRY